MNTTNTPNPEDLAQRVAEALPLEAAIDAAYKAVVDNAPCGHWSDDALDYINAAATVYAELVGIARTGGIHDQTEYIAWLAQPPYETWGATDGDFRWWLADLIADIDPVASAEWADLTEHIYD